MAMYSSTAAASSLKGAFSLRMSTRVDLRLRAYTHLNARRRRRIR